MSWNLLDFVFIGVLGLFFLMSYFHGTLREIISLLGIFAGFIAAHWYHVAVGDLIAPIVPNVAVAETIAFIGFVGGGYMAGAFISGLGDYYRGSGGSFGSRIIAGVMGLGKGLAVSLAMLWLIDTHFPPLQDELAESIVAKGLVQVVRVLQDMNVL